MIVFFNIFLKLLIAKFNLFMETLEIGLLVNLTSLNLIQILGASLLAVLFLQSGLDKIFDWKGNLAWLTDHFSKSIFKNIVGFLLLIITILEVFAGIFSLLGVFAILFEQTMSYALIGAILSAFSLLALFTGQRIAKDYAGAGSLVNYFILSILMIYLLSI